MAFEWTEFLRVAKEFALSDDEASGRSAISRAYYAAFGVAASKLREAGHDVPEDGAAHLVVWQTFENADDGPLYFIGLDGHNLRRLRRLADYDSTVSISRNDIQKTIGVADRTVQAIKRNAAPSKPSS